MAIEIEDYWLISELCKKFKIKGKVLILGDCYYHFNHKDIGVIKKADIQQDVFIDTLNFDSVETVDIEGNPTFKLDLAGELPKNLTNLYDFIIDAGTVCCCFDVSSVLKNIHSLLKNGGHILHISYFSGFFGRGYYSFQPMFFQDYFKVNNYSLSYLGIRNKNRFCGFLRKFFRKRYLWKKMEKNSIYFNGKILGKHISKDPYMIPNNMVISAFAKKNNNAGFIMPTPLLMNENKYE